MSIESDNRSTEIELTEQTGAELGQAQLKLGLDFTLIFFRFGLHLVFFIFSIEFALNWPIGTELGNFCSSYHQNPT